MDILISAEPYGYGPVAKAVAITRELRRRGHRLVFMGSGVAYDFALENSELFGRIDRVEADLEYLAVVPGMFDIAITVMEPVVALRAHQISLPVVYVDSLYWMWEWPDSELDRLQALTSQVRVAEPETALATFSAIDMHDAQYVGHALSDLILAQKYGVLEPSSARLALSTREVGGIVTRQGAQPKSGAILASISGLKNPLTSSAQAAAWATAVVGMLIDAHEESRVEAPLRVVGNADVLAELPFSSNESVRIESVANHSDLLDLLALAPLSIAPPGITSVVEAWANDVPFLPLPPQHYAHDTILARLESADPGSFPQLRIDGLHSEGDREAHTGSIIDRVSEHLLGPNRAAAVSFVADAIAAAVNDRAASVTRQKSVLANVFGSPEGAVEVADFVETAASGSRNA